MKQILIIFAALLIVLIVTADASRRRLLNPGTASGASTPDVLWNKLNEGSGTVFVGASTAGSDGGTNLTSWSTSTASGSGACLVFSGGSAMAVSSNNIAPGSNFETVSVWWFPFNTNIAQCVLETSTFAYANSYAWGIYSEANGTINVLLSGATGSSQYRQESFPTVSTNAWHHLLVALDGTTGAGDIRLWLDGVEQSPISTTASRGSGTGNFGSYKLYYGSRGGTTMPLYGRIDDVRRWSTDKTASVSQIYADPQ